MDSTNISTVVKCSPCLIFLRASSKLPMVALLCLALTGLVGCNYGPGPFLSYAKLKAEGKSVVTCGDLPYEEAVKIPKCVED